MNLFKEIKEILAKELAIDEEQILPDTSLQDDLDADTAALAVIAGMLESRYRLKLKIDDLAVAENVGELVQIIESKLA